jgi:hypothetical protein
MVQPDHRHHAQSSPPNTELSRDGKTRAAASPSPGSPNRLSPSSAQRERYAWCPTCRRTRPCVRNLGTTDWQTTPVYTCRMCGRVIHEPQLDPSPRSSPGPVLRHQGALMHHPVLADNDSDRHEPARKLSATVGSRVATATSPELRGKR